MKIKEKDGIYYIVNKNGSIVGFFKTLELAKIRLRKEEV